MAQFSKHGPRWSDRRRPSATPLRERVIEQLFSCPLINGDIDHDGCMRLSGDPLTNLNGCVKEKCGSPWRLCVACTASGAEHPRFSANTDTGFCGPDAKDGPRRVAEAQRRLAELAAKAPAPRSANSKARAASKVRVYARRRISVVPADAISLGTPERAHKRYISPGHRVEDPLAELAEIEALQQQYREWKPEHVAKHKGVSRGWVDQRLMLRGLSPGAKAMMDPALPAHERLTFAKARAVAIFPHPIQEEVAREVLAMPNDQAFNWIRARAGKTFRHRQPRKGKEAAAV